MAIAEIDGSGSIRTLETVSQGVNLGKDTFTRGMIRRATIEDCVRVLKSYRQLLCEYQIVSNDQIRIVATSAVREGDFLVLRTGQLGKCRSEGWGSYAGGDAPGLSFYAADWLHRSKVAAIITDTWGMEVRPNELPNSFQPLHQVLIPNMGLPIGEIWNLDELAADCAADGTYEFMLVAPPLPITGAVGSPVNPQAIK